MATKNPPAEPSADREIVVSRVFNAPRELVWEAWTNPEHVVRWWGPNGFSTTIEEMDVRPGGVWQQVMHGPDGTNYPNKSVFKEVVKPERIVYSHGGGREGGPGAQFVSTWTFEALGAQTRLTIRMVFATAAERDLVVREFGAIEGGKQTLGRLATHLAETRAQAFTGQAPVRELVLTRFFKAPCETVFQAWTDPRQLAQWWGPKGFTNPVCEADARPGGAILIHMLGPDGVIIPMDGTFHEVYPSQRLVFASAAHADAAGNPQIETLNTITLVAEGGGTKLTLRALVVYVSPAMAGAVAGMEAGWSQSLDKLRATLEPGYVVPEHEFVISRMFDAPRALVFKVWTNPAHLQRWFGPKGFSMPTCRMDLRPGGNFLYNLRSPDGKELWGKFAYLNIIEPELIVFINSFSDKNGGLTRHPFSPTWPLKLLTCTTFEEIEGRTKLTIRWSPVNATDEENQTFDTSHASMTVGWSGTFDQLVDYLAKTKASQP